MNIHDLLTQYAQHQIKLTLVPKRVKNINFRLKPCQELPFTSVLVVSYPPRIDPDVLSKSLQSRLAWAIECQAKQHRSQHPPKRPAYFNQMQDLQALTLEDEVLFEGQKITVQALFCRHFRRTDVGHLDIARTLVGIYRAWLSTFIGNRQPIWEAKVGKAANNIKPYTMKTRWGSCSPRAKSIRLSVWLAQFEPSCADYVLVHELCHLHEANHSPRFWAQVARVMPEYKIWHDRLKHGG